MKHFQIFIINILFSAYFCQLCSCATPTNPQYILPAGLAVDCARQVSLIGPIPIKIRFQNLTPRRSVDISIGSEASFIIHLYHNLEECPLTKRGANMQNQACSFNWTVDRNRDMDEGSDAVYNMSPFGETEYVVDLSKMFVISSPGKYTVLIQRNVALPPDIVIGATAKFVILDKEEGERK